MKTLNEEVKYPKIIFAGDRDISVWVLEYLIQTGIKPIALLISDEKNATHAQNLITLCNHLDNSKILVGEQVRTKECEKLIDELKPDFIICIHFPYIIPKRLLEIPKHGVVNLHPAYLPYNRGWHTPTWAIWEKTVYGATLHFMNEKVDEGDIIHQKQIEILPNDTANTLYKRVKQLELEVFKEAWSSLMSGDYNRKPQAIANENTHKKTDIESIQRINLDEYIKAEDLIRRIKALTTNDIKESTYFEDNGKLYRVQISIVEDK